MRPTAPVSRSAWGQFDMEGKKTKSPGIYRISAEEYHSIDAVSNSALSLLAESPRHLLYRREHPLSPTPAMRLGTLLHAAILEPGRVAEKFEVCPNFHLDDRNRTSAGARSNSKSTEWARSKFAEHAAAHTGKEIVSADIFEKMSLRAASLSCCRSAMDCLTGGEAELSAVWADGVTSLLCKGRADYVTSTRVVDLKTTAGGATFDHVIGQRGYHRQMAHYQRGIGTHLEPWIIAIDSLPPHCVRCAPVSSAAIIAGKAELDNLLRTLRNCEVSGVWPGYKSPCEWTVPDRYLLQSESLESWIQGGTQNV